MNRYDLTDSIFSLDRLRSADDTERMEYAIELERSDVEKKMARFYRIEIERDLFGILIARRTWGRIGTMGRTIAAPCLSLEDAERELRLWETRKRRRGYRDRAPV